MKKLCKFVSLMLSLALCLGMVSPAFAASFDDLNEAISSELGGEVNASGTENGTQYQEGSWGFGWNSEASQWGVQASQGEDGSRNVQLNEDVKYDSENDTSSTITVGEDQNVNLDLNDKNITGDGENDVIDVENGGSLTVTGGESTDEGTNIISGGANGIDVSGDLTLDGVTVSGNETGVNVNEGGSADIQNSTITNNSIGLFFVPDSTVTFTGNQNVVTNNTSKNISGDGKVNFKLGETTYQVDADAAEALLAGEDSVAAHGTDWILAKNDGGETFTVIYTGTGNYKKILAKAHVQEAIDAAVNAAECEGSAITGFVIPKGVETIGGQAFRNQVNLTSITISDTVTVIQDNAFMGCTNLKSIVIPNTVTQIGNSLFSGCSSLTSASLPDCITEINEGLFYNCTSLTSFVISPNITKIGHSAFWGSGLTSITIPENVTTIDSGAFYLCKALENVTISEGVVSIGSSAFRGCSSLNHISIPASVKSVGDQAFRLAGLTSVEVPATVETLGTDVFANCDFLNVIILHGETSDKANEKLIIGDHTSEPYLDIHCNIYFLGEDGTVKFGRNKEVRVDITTPNGTEIEIIRSDGSAVLPAGTVMTDKDGSKTDLPHGGQINANGTYTVNPHTYTNKVTKEATCTENGERADVCNCGDKTNVQTILATGHTPGEPVRENEVPAQIGAAGSYDEVVYCSVCGYEISRETMTIDLPDPPETPDVPGIIIPDPDVPMADGSGADAATIEDQEVPLAGLMPVAQLLEELRQYEEIEEIELPEDFKWIDHEYAQAIYWGLQEGLVVDTEEEPFDPDEVVTVALMRDVLANFVELYKGLENFVFTLEGEDDEIVMDLGERLTAFYGELEDYLKAQEAKAA